MLATASRKVRRKRLIRCAGQYDVLDTVPEEVVLDDLTELAARILARSAIAFDLLVDENRQWFNPKWDWTDTWKRSGPMSRFARAPFSEEALCEWSI